MFSARDRFIEELQGIEEAGLWKQERVITSPQGSSISTADGEALNFLRQQLPWAFQSP